MKKILLFTAALAIMASCVKENAIETPSEGSYTIHASIADVTKTAYSASGVFTWKTNDVARVVVCKAAEPHNADHYDFKAQADGASVDFKSNGEPDWTTWPKSGFALYPALSHGGSAGNLTVTLPDTYTVTGSDFTAIGIPMIGTEVADDDWSFKTAVGVLKVQLTNVPVAARKLVITDDYNRLAGTWPLDATAASNGLDMSECVGGTYSVTVNFPQQTAGSTIDVYVPIPVGTLSIGTTFDVQQSDGTSIKLMTTTKTIPVVRNKIQPITGISVEDWVSVGTGKYMDDHGFYYLGDDGRSASDYVDVEIEKHATEAGRYRIQTPYASCTDVAAGLPDAAEYLYIDIIDAGRGIVANHSYKYDGGSYIMFDAPYWGYDALYHNSRIINYDGSGDPANIQLAPYYYDFYSANCAQNPKIEIVFPGSTPMLANAFGYAGATTATYDSGDVTVSMAYPATSVKVKAATSIDAAAKALMDGTYDLEFTASGTQALTGLASLTSYYLVYQVETAANGYTLKKGGSFMTGEEIPLNASMISVNVDAGDRDGNHYDGSGPGALVDNDTDTFWHTPYYTAAYLAYWQGEGYFSNITGTPYEFADLDATYGAFIDIDLDSETVTNFQVRACLRSASSDFPKHVLIYTSPDHSVWTKVGEVENVCSGISAGSWINPIDCTSSAARYIRFSIIENTSSKDLRDPSAEGCTHLAEIKIFE